MDEHKRARACAYIWTRTLNIFSRRFRVFFLPTPEAISLRHFPTDFPARRQRPTLRHLRTRACCFPIHFRSHGSQGSARVAFSTLSRYYWDDGLRAPVCRDRIDHDRRGRCIGYHYASDRAPSLRAEYIADRLLGEPLWR